jgi:CubicO group peptidase (beta-lactamase class C family)
MTGEGLSDAGITRMRAVMAGHVERGEMPGLITLVARGPHRHVEVIGAGAFGDTAPLGRDAIFRIASLSKPIAAVAAMMLVDDGVLRLADPVEEFLPELAGQRVLRRMDADLDDTVPAVRRITVEDLLTFRLGFGSVMAPPGSYPIQAAEERLQLCTLGPPWPPPPHPPEEWIRHFGTLPLLHQPGQRWMYNTGAQVLGVLLQRAAGQPLEELLAERLFGPLGMTDTGFSVPPAKRGRFTTAYQPDPESGALTVLDSPEGSYWADPPVFPNAAGWLVSTIDDFWSFVRLLLSGGTHDGRRILSQTSARRMLTDQLTAGQRAGAAPFLSDGTSWGLGLAVPAAGPSVGVIPRGFGWDGGTGTTWRSDPRTGLTGILFTQRSMTSPEPPQAFTDFWHAAFGCLDG